MDTKTSYIDLNAYPPWLVVLVGAVVAALALWVLMKVLKWALWLLIIAVLVVGFIWAASLFVHPG